MEINKSKLALDPNNSSTANLGAGGQFIGAASVAPQGGTITVFLHTDQILNCVLYIEQSADGTNWDHLLTFNPDEDAPSENNSESWSVRSLADYYRIRVYNTGSPTTYFRLATRVTVNGSGGCVMLVDDDGHPIEASLDSNNEYHLGVTTLQSVYSSTKNRWSDNLPVGAVFVGTQETTLGVAAIQTALKSDQNAQVVVEQTFDGTNWDIADTYNYYAALGGESWTTQAIGDGYRLRVKNTGTATSTVFRVGAALCPIVESVPRTLSPNGNFQVAVNELLGTFGTQVKSTPMGQMRTADTSRLVGAAFGDSPVLDLNFWGSVTVGTGTIIPGGNMAYLQTGASVAGAGTLRSFRIARYVATNPILYRGVIRVPAASGPCIRRWGAYSQTDGFIFEWNGSDLTLICRKGGADTNRVASGSFNGEAGNWYSPDANAHTYEIYWTNKSVWFCVDDVILHKFTGATAPLTNSCSLPVAGEVFNTAGNTGNNALEVRTSSISRLGPLVTEPIYKYIAATGTTVCKYGAGRLHRVLFHDVTSHAQNITIADSQGNFSPIIGNTIIANANSFYPFGMEYNAPFFTGLTVVTSAAFGITVVYE